MNDLVNRAQKALKRIQARNEDARWTYGTVGRLVDGVAVYDVPGRAGYLFVTIRQSNGAQTSVPARNDGGVSKALGLPVRMRREGTTFVIDSVARRDDIAYTSPGQLGDPHTHDNRYFTEAEHISTSAGAADAGKPVKTDSGGLFSATFLTGVEQTVLGATDRFLMTVSGVLKWSTYATLRDSIKSYYDSVVATLTNKSIDASANTLTNVNTSALSNDAVSNAKLANMAQSTLKGRQAGSGTGDPEDLTAAQAMAILKATQLLGDAGIYVVTDGTSGIIERITTATGGSIRNVVELKATSTGSAADGFGPAFFFTFNDLETSGQNFLGVIGAVRSGADNTGRMEFRVYKAGVAQVVGQADADKQWSFGTINPQAIVHAFQSTLGSRVMRQESDATNDNPIRDFLQGRAATTNNTVTTLFTMAIPASHACVMEAIVIGRRTGGSAGAAEDCAAYLIRGLFNQVAGAAAIVAQSQTVIGESQAAWDCVFDVNGTDARIRVTGATNNNVTWHAHVLHQFLST